MAHRTGSHTLALTVAAGLAGAGLALLFAPRSGRETRARIRKRAHDLKEQADEKMATARDSLHEDLEHARDLKARLSHKAKRLGHQVAASREETSDQLPASSSLSSWEEEV
jgi:gas vesicle protein